MLIVAKKGDWVPTFEYEKYEETVFAIFVKNIDLYRFLLTQCTCLNRKVLSTEVQCTHYCMCVVTMDNNIVCKQYIPIVM